MRILFGPQTKLHPWVQGLSDWECAIIGEADCSGLFDKVHSHAVMAAFVAATKWLAKKQRWNASDLV